MSGGILDSLNDAQRQAVEMRGGPVLVIAGAGSGKTRTLVHRVAHIVDQGQPPESILLLTFTRRAAAEMLSRAVELNPQCRHVSGGTFHSLCNRLMRRWASRVGLQPNFTILDPADAEQLIRGSIQELGVKGKTDKSFPKPRTIFGAISKARNMELTIPELIETQADHLWEYAQPIEQIAQAYARSKALHNQVDYDDLLFMTEDLLKGNPDIRGELNAKWRHVLVDEYQDTNAVQARLLALLASGGQEIMVVGDDAQSIYRFRGARISNIFEFPEVFAGTRVVKLERNYRSTQPILDLTNAIIAAAAHRYDKKLYTETTEGVAPKLERPRDERGQSRLVTERIRSLLAKGAKHDDIAVLFRAGRDSFDLERELTAEHISYVKYGGLKFLEAAHIKDVLAHLRVIANPQDFISWQRILLLMPGVGPAKAQQIIARVAMATNPSQFGTQLRQSPYAEKTGRLRQLADLLDEISDLGSPPLDKMEAVLEYYEPVCKEQFEDWPRRMRDLGELPGLARQYESMEELLAELVLDPPSAHAEELAGGRITLSTVHSAKGMEWPHVFVIWAADGRLPAHASIGDPEAVEEERRLMYVACTRAARELTIVAPRESYSRFEGLRPQELSRFLDGLPDGVLAGQSAGGGVFSDAFLRAAGAAPAADAPARETSARRVAGTSSGVGNAAVARRLLNQDRPYAVSSMVSHAKFGKGKVMGYKGEDKIMVYFQTYGLKTLVLKFAGLEQAE